MNMELVKTQTHLPESDWVTDGSNPVREGVYKRKVFIQGSDFYSRWENGRWYECFHCSDSPEHDLSSFTRAALTTRTSDFQKSSAWRGLAEEFKP